MKKTTKYGLIATVATGALALLMIFMTVSVIQSMGMPQFKTEIVSMLKSYNINLNDYGFSIDELINSVKNATYFLCAYSVILFILSYLGNKKNIPPFFMAAFIMSIFMSSITIASGILPIIILSVAISILLYLAYNQTKIKARSAIFNNTSNYNKTVIDIDQDL